MLVLTVERNAEMLNVLTAYLSKGLRAGLKAYFPVPRIFGFTLVLLMLLLLL
jgi:hypothetical protein